MCVFDVFDVFHVSVGRVCHVLSASEEEKRERESFDGSWIIDSVKRKMSFTPIELGGKAGRKKIHKLGYQSLHRWNHFIISVHVL